MFRRRLAKAMAGAGATDAPQTTENATSYPADLPPEKHQEYDKLVAEIRLFLNSNRLSKLRGYVKEKVVRRLLEKLQESHLGEDSVPTIASSVWHEIHDASGGEVLESRSEIKHIVEDILDEYQKRMPAFARIAVRAYVSMFCKVEDELVEIVVREMWPEIRQKLGV